jgi:hypothetical protein
METYDYYYVEHFCAIKLLLKLKPFENETETLSLLSSHGKSLSPGGVDELVIRAGYDKNVPGKLGLPTVI